MLAQRCQHVDAQFLVSLFPEEAPASNAEQAKRAFLARADDPRCLCWASHCWLSGVENGPNVELLRRSAEAGYAWGEQCFARYCDDAEEAAWLEKAAAQGEPEAMFALGESLWSGIGTIVDKSRASELWREAALLGCARGQLAYGEKVCMEGSLEQFVWLRRAVLQCGGAMVARLTTLDWRIR